MTPRRRRPPSPQLAFALDRPDDVSERAQRDGKARRVFEQLVTCLNRRDSARLERDRPHTDPERRAYLDAKVARLCAEQDELERLMTRLVHGEDAS